MLSCFVHLSPKLSPKLPWNFSFSPLVWIHRDGPWLAQLSGDQHFSLPAVSRGNRYALVSRVRPVDVLVDPVYGQTLGGVEGVDESHLLRWVTGLVDVSTSEKYRWSVSVRFIEIMM